MSAAVSLLLTTTSRYCPPQTIGTGADGSDSGGQSAGSWIVTGPEPLLLVRLIVRFVLLATCMIVKGGMRHGLRSSPSPQMPSVGSANVRPGYPGSVTLAVTATGSPSSSKRATMSDRTVFRSYGEPGVIHGTDSTGRVAMCTPSSSRTAPWFDDTGVGAFGAVTSIIWKPPGCSRTGP